jgi:hypothetical protein
MIATRAVADMSAAASQSSEVQPVWNAAALARATTNVGAQRSKEMPGVHLCHWCTRKTDRQDTPRERERSMPAASRFGRLVGFGDRTEIERHHISTRTWMTARRQGSDKHAPHDSIGRIRAG